MSETDQMNFVASLRTEMECFQALEEIGQVNYSYFHGHGYSPEDDIAAICLHKIQKMIVKKLEREYGIIYVPYGSTVAVFVPAGKTLYWTWYEKMKKINKERALKETICSACPFCDRDKLNYSDDVPCSIFRGYATGLFKPYECLMVRKTSGDYTRADFFREMEAKSGADAVNIFRQKELRLKLLWSRERIALYKHQLEKGDGVDWDYMTEFIRSMIESGFHEEAKGFVEYLTENYAAFIGTYPRIGRLMKESQKESGV